MNLEALEKAQREAVRFMRACTKVRVEPSKYNPKPHVIENTKETAACKRASLDLTRALSELRKP